MSVESIDLNLLLVLHTVLEERNVARAARRLHVTPSAVSNALARLRGILGDPLVTRQGRGIVPTPRAVELAPVIARGIRELDSALHSVAFDAANCTRTLTIALADAGQVTSLPRIAQRFRKELPRAHLRVVGIDSLVSLGDLSSAEVDLHLGVKAPGVHSEPLFEEPSLLVARRGHASLGKRLSASALAALSHVRVDMLPGKGLRDQIGAAYARAGLERNVVMTVPSFTAAVAIVASTDLVATVPESLLEVHPKLQRVSGPMPAHSVEISMNWHDRTEADPAARALRGIVRAAIA